MSLKEMSLKKLLGEFPTAFRNFGEDIKLTGVSRLLFLRSEWESIEFSNMTVVSLVYLLYRFIFCCYFVIFLCFSIMSTSNPGFWMLMATNWNFLSQTIYSVLAFINVAQFYVRQKLCKEPPFYHEYINFFESVIWFFLSLAYSIPQFISITYWLFVYKPTPIESLPDGVTAGSIIGLSLTVHGINAALAFVDVIIVASPVRVTHFVYPVIMNGLYLLFSGLYEVAGGPYRYEDKPYIYPILNWRQSPPVGAIITCFVATISIILFHFLFWFIHILRIHLAEKTRPLKLHYDYENSTSNFEESFNERKPLLKRNSY